MKVFASTLLAILLAFSGLTAEAKTKNKLSPGYHKAAAYINAGKKERKQEKAKKKIAKNKKPAEKKKIAKAKKIAEKRKVASVAKHKKIKKH